MMVKRLVTHQAALRFRFVSTDQALDALSEALEVFHFQILWDDLAKPGEHAGIVTGNIVTIAVWLEHWGNILRSDITAWCVYPSQEKKTLACHNGELRGLEVIGPLTDLSLQMQGDLHSIGSWLLFSAEMYVELS
ncbi:hypothetical protein C5B42_04290 [Candidatus Cerribacteria bacterium 'Amazon FNV 2010 28 9']|uniref:Uncharacterized protein n=1 Tax=Candidatus Cerribacteria bacterium 'Amazon FNV 2010 28 9' TaxID=2081795 RepID=A0A317JN11_9BACT|nr:MAG: hypothetical protein C5B42_04290 [Candidatus Cerribacteria bacterium 'Amazon FNV 2010 28 9']